MRPIAYNHRVFVCGHTGSGKSTIARAIFASAAEPRLVVDPNSSKLTASLPGTHTVPGAEGRRALLAGGDVRRIVRRALDQALAAGARTLRYVPADPFSREEYDAVYAWAFAHAPMFVWTDEAGIVAPANASPPAFRRLLVQGRKRQAGHVGAHTRPLEVDRNAIAQAEHVIVMQLPHPGDRETVAALAGIPPRELNALLDDLEPYGFVLIQGGGAEVTVCPPLAQGA